MADHHEGSRNMRDARRPFGVAGANGVVATACFGCNSTVSLDVAQGTVEAADGAWNTITYADPDIVVWDCSACGATNAEAVNE